jgi:hypothetical protein
MNEIAGMWKEAGVASLKYDPSIYMERRKRNTKGTGKDSRPSGQDFSRGTSKRAAEFLFTDSDWKLKTVSSKMALILTADVCCLLICQKRKPFIVSAAIILCRLFVTIFDGEMFVKQKARSESFVQRER